MGQEIETMMIYMLAVAMTIMMLIATAFSMHQETQRTRVKQKNNTINVSSFTNYTQLLNNEMLSRLPTAIPRKIVR